MNILEGYQFVGVHFFWWVALVLTFVWIYALRDDSTGKRKRKDSPLDILKRRFIEGEIDNYEYLRKKNILEKG